MILLNYSVAVPTPDATANTTVQVLIENVICIHGVPDSIVTDQGTNFMSDIFKNTCKILSIKKIYTKSYHP